MKKWLKAVLIVSLLMNAVLTITIIAGREYVKQIGFELVIMNLEADMMKNQMVLDALESNDPERIETMKKLLNIGVENCKRAAASFRAALEK